MVNLLKVGFLEGVIIVAENERNKVFETQSRYAFQKVVVTVVVGLDSAIEKGKLANQIQRIGGSEAMFVLLVMQEVQEIFAAHEGFSPRKAIE